MPTTAACASSVYWAYQTRASDQGPDAGRFDNSERIERILALRHEAAQLLGFANAAEESLATKMADRRRPCSISCATWPHARGRWRDEELDDLRAFAAEQLGLANLEPWDVGLRLGEAAPANATRWTRSSSSPTSRCRR